MIAEVARVTARQLLGRRRTTLMALLALIPVALAALFRMAAPDTAGAADAFIESVLMALALTLLLPLVALVFGTTAFGAEVEDGTVVYLLAKPVPRQVIVLTKWVVAAVIATVLAATATLLAGVLGLLGKPGGMEVSVGYAVGVASGCVVYTAVFVALSLVTSRALIAGLVYVLAWEGTLAASFPGVRFLSIRQYALGIADAAGVGSWIDSETLEPATAVLLSVVVVLVALVVAIRRLGGFQIPQAD